MIASTVVRPRFARAKDTAVEPDSQLAKGTLGQAEWA